MDMHESDNYMHMKTRTTLILDDELLEEARRLTGLEEKTAVVHEALRALVRRESARQLAELGGSQPDLKPIPRRRSEPDR
jgi:Arc/MetJ family transcription regulator